LGYAALATAYYTRTWFSCKILLILCDPNVAYEFMSNDFMPLYMTIPYIHAIHACMHHDETKTCLDLYPRVLHRRRVWLESIMEPYRKDLHFVLWVHFGIVILANPIRDSRGIANKVALSPRWITLFSLFLIIISVLLEDLHGQSK